MNIMTGKRGEFRWRLALACRRLSARPGSSGQPHHRTPRLTLIAKVKVKLNRGLVYSARIAIIKRCVQGTLLVNMGVNH